jgi:hypothetical protein
MDIQKNIRDSEKSELIQKFRSKNEQSENKHAEHRETEAKREDHDRWNRFVDDCCRIRDFEINFGHIFDKFWVEFVWSMKKYFVELIK